MYKHHYGINNTFCSPFLTYRRPFCFFRFKQIPTFFMCGNLRPERRSRSPLDFFLITQGEPGPHSPMPSLASVHYSATCTCYKTRVQLCGMFTHTRKNMLLGISVWEMENTFRLDSLDSLHKIHRIHFQVEFTGLVLSTVENRRKVSSLWCPDCMRKRETPPDEQHVQSTCPKGCSLSE